MPNGEVHKIARISLDLDLPSKQFLRMFAMENNVPLSVILRCMIYIAETDIDFQNRIIDEIYLAPEEEDIAIEYDPDAEEE